MILKTPWMLLFLLLLPILGWFLIRAQRLQDVAAEKLRGSRGRSSRGIKKNLALRLGSFAALIMALAQPAWNPHPGPSGMKGRDLVIALDISRSMLAADVFPSRLDAAKIAIFESLDHLRGQRIGLITFAGSASVRVPLTLDHNFVRYMLDRAAPSDADVGSTSIQSAIEKAIDVALKESEKGHQDMILFTDGEDYLSNIEKTAEELRECGARVLIIGLGDPVAGARIPDSANTNAWMQYKGADVITRLDEAKLTQLAAESPNVTYYPAGTRPFELTSIYRNMLTETGEIPADETGQMIYTEGYPWLIALALLLFIFPLSGRILPLLAALVIAGCSPSVQTLEADFATQIESGCTLWLQAQTAVTNDPRAALSILLDARKAFLCAAMIRPGNIQAAEQIAGVSQQIRLVEQAVKDQKKAEEDLQAKLKAAIEELKILTQRETVLSQQSQQLLKKRPPATPEESAADAISGHKEQSEVGDGTDKVLEVIKTVQSMIQKMLLAAYSDNGTPPPTEMDQAADKLVSARESQQAVISNLSPDAVNWPQANSALLTASRRMQEALTLLSDQNKGNNSDQESQESDQSQWDFDDHAEWSESDKQGDLSMPMNSQSFKTALENQSLPAPNYTAEEIMMEESANMEQRAQQKAGRAGATVEKNW
jgi:Mg-chelatase subunit ChlD